MSGTITGDAQAIAGIRLVALTDFTTTPGGRYAKDGPFSGEEFRERYLVPAFAGNEQTIIVDLDGAFGLPPGFLEEAFGGLARKLGKREVLRRLKLRCLDDFTVARDVAQYIEGAEK